MSNVDDLLKQLHNNEVVSLNFNRGRRRRRRNRVHGGDHHRYEDEDDDFIDLSSNGRVAMSPDEEMLIGLDEDEEDEAHSLLEEKKEDEDFNDSPSFAGKHKHRGFMDDEKEDEDAASSVGATRPVILLLSQALISNSSLVSLDLGHTRLDSSGADSISRALYHNKTLKELALSHNKIGTRGAQALSRVLSVNETVVSLDLSANCIYNEGAIALGRMLVKNKTLTSLDVTHSDVFVEGCKAIFNALRENNTLKELHMSRNCMWIDASRVLAAMLSQNTSLTKLDVSSNFIYEDGIAVISKGLGNNNTIKELHLSSNEMGDVGAKAVAGALRNNTSLEVLLLHDNRIGAEGAKALGKALLKNKGLKTLHLCDNEIGPLGCDGLGKAFKHNGNTTLSQLYLAANEILCDGIKTLAANLKFATGLTEINLSWNRLGAEGLNYVANGLKENTSLKGISLSHNKGYDDGAFAVAEAVMANTTLERLDMSNNRLRLPGIISISRAMQNNHTITGLDLSGNRAPAPHTDVEQYLNRNIARNRRARQLTLMMAFHERAGRHSALRRVFNGDYAGIADINVFRHVWDMLWLSEKDQKKREHARALKRQQMQNKTNLRITVPTRNNAIPQVPNSAAGPVAAADNGTAAPAGVSNAALHSLIPSSNPLAQGVNQGSSRLPRHNATQHGMGDALEAAASSQSSQMGLLDPSDTTTLSGQQRRMPYRSNAASSSQDFQVDSATQATRRVSRQRGNRNGQSDSPHSRPTIVLDDPPPQLSGAPQQQRPTPMVVQHVQHTDVRSLYSSPPQWRRAARHPNVSFDRHANSVWSSQQTQSLPAVGDQMASMSIAQAAASANQPPSSSIAPATGRDPVRVFTADDSNSVGVSAPDDEAAVEEDDDDGWGDLADPY